jgi:hypothetical protein
MSRFNMFHTAISIAPIGFGLFAFVRDDTRETYRSSRRLGERDGPSRAVSSRMPCDKSMNL